MKILGTNTTDYCKKSLIIEIEYKELEHLLGAYYSNKIPGMEKKVEELKAGDVVLVMHIADMSGKIAFACGEMVKTMDAFKKAQECLLSFATLVAEQMGRGESEDAR